jgi:hypothetical protein
MSKTIKTACFINAAKGLTVYVAAPISLHQTIEDLGHVTLREDGKKLYPSMAVNLPATLNNVRFCSNLAETLKGGKFVVEVEFNDDSELRFYETSEGNAQMGITGANIDFSTVGPFVPRVNVPESTDNTDATPEELEVLRIAKERADARTAKNIAASEEAEASLIGD